MFCNADQCTPRCPAYTLLELGETHCQIVNAMLEAEEAKKKAYETMEDYWKNKNDR